MIFWQLSAVVWGLRGIEMRKWIINLLAGLSALAVQAELTLSNLAVRQAPGTKTVEITYDVTDVGTGSVDVSLAVSNGTQAVSATSLTGDVGTDVTAGTGKMIVWDGGADWNGQVASLQYSLTADDGINAVVSCPVPQTGQTNSYRTGDDGNLKAGIAWPNPRFDDRVDTVVDNLTGLEWIKTPGQFGVTNWNGAVDFCDELNFSGDSDWRLPNLNELRSVFDYGSASPVATVFGLAEGTHYYWSSTTISSSTNNAWMLRSDSAGSTDTYKSNYKHVWPVRLSVTGTSAPVPKTGQTVEYRSGDDGSYEAGTSWPSPRFVDLGDTILDNLTGLEWVQEPEDSKMVWNDAVDFCNGSNFNDHSDWRLPNVKELEGLVHYGVGTNSPAHWLNSAETPFDAIREDGYWTGTSRTSYQPGGSAFLVSMAFEGIVGESKNNLYYVWPVRTWQSEDDADVVSSGTDTRDYTLTVISDYGSPVPVVGTNTYAWGTNLTLSAGSESNYLCLGWSGTGSVPASGTNDMIGSVVLTNNPVSTITWNWEAILEGFALWADELGLEGDPEELFIRDHNGDGIANGFEYAFGDNLSSNSPLLKIVVIDGQPLVETPARDPETFAYVDTMLWESEDMASWFLDTVQVNGAPTGLLWHRLAVPAPNAFFRLGAELK